MPVNRYRHGIFSLDNTTTYSRWLSVHVHIRDMDCFETEIPAIAAEFKNSNFGVNKARHAFSLLPVDQAHEQSNEIAKGD